MDWTRGQMRDINHFCHRHFKLNPRLLIVTTSKPALPAELPISEVQFLFSVAPAEDLGVTVESFLSFIFQVQSTSKYCPLYFQNTL